MQNESSHIEENIIASLKKGDKLALARAISLIENESSGYEKLLEQLDFNKNIPIIGITGPPGAGKSTLINALSKYLASKKKKVAVIAVDPSSPFTRGALMGDRVRMSENFLHPDIFIRSMATRGSLGGLAPKIFEVADIMRAAHFDYIIIETVGVGQSEVDIAALADTTILVLVPEAGDEIQTMKNGVMEIADIFVLNKADREGADVFYKSLLMLVHNNIKGDQEAKVLKTIATREEGIPELFDAIDLHFQQESSDKKLRLLAEKALIFIKNQRTKDIQISQMEQELKKEMQAENFNLYRFVKNY